MDWLQVTVYTTAEGIEPVSGVLYQTGVTGLEIEDFKDFTDFLENNRGAWDYVDEDLMRKKEKETCIKLYLSDNAAGHEQLSAVRTAIDSLKKRDTDGLFGRLELELGNMSEEDWANNWKQYFHPLEVGKRILIRPEWEEAKPVSDKIVFSVNPGMSFGTGSHHTTQLCLEELEKYVTNDTVLLDLGCGSGILSIIAVMLGAKSAVAVDIDPNAVDIAYENAERNGVGRDRYTALAGDILTDTALREKIGKEKYPVVVANIVADVIIALAPAAREFITDGGVFVTSGIIENRLDEVILALTQNGFEVKNVNKRADWAAVTCAAI